MTMISAIPGSTRQTQNAYGISVPLLMRNFGFDSFINMFLCNSVDVFTPLAPIFGMFGVNLSIMTEDERTMPFFATKAYRDALIYIEELVALGAVYAETPEGAPRADVPDFFHNINVGWTAARADTVLNEILGSRLGQTRNMTILITPPEIGNSGQRGVGLKQTVSPFNPHGEAWVIGSHVSDEVLARILIVFNAMAFEQEHLISTMVGEAAWEAWLERGVPPLLNGNVYNNNISTGIYHRDVWTREFNFRANPLFEYLSTDAARRMVLYPHKNDVHNQHAIERSQLDARRKFPRIVNNMDRRQFPPLWTARFYDKKRSVPRTMDEVAQDFLILVLRGSSSVELMWDEYYEQLVRLGLEEYVRLYRKYE
jgi:hypothetical protein